MLTVLDLFSGIGGFSLGLEKSGGFKTIEFCEIEPFCRKVLNKHWPGVPIHDDIRTLSRPTGYADVICGGFPCQDLSYAGKGAGINAGTRSGLWSDYARIIGEVRPRYIIVENVAALLTRGIDRVLGDLAQIGYDAEWHCIPASAVGAPHRRDRVWIVAYPNTSIGRGGEKREPFWNGEPSLHGENGQTITNPSCRGGGCNGVRQTREGQPVDPGADLAHAKRRGPQSGNVRSPDETAVLTPEISGESRKGAYAADAESQCVRTGLCEDEQGGKRRGRSGDSSGEIPHPHNAGRTQQRITLSIAEELATVELSGGWAVEPDVGRVAHGVPSRVDRLKSLGNAVVPQIPELIGRAILKSLEQSPGVI